MKLRIAWIGKTKEPAIASLTNEYLKRTSRYASLDSQEFATEAAFVKAVEKSPAFVILLDPRGKQLSSEDLARFIDDHQNRGTAAVMFAIGPADGFGEEARRLASFQLSLGKMTMAHEIARVVLLEQIYRAFTILKGHPYHTGH